MSPRSPIPFVLLFASLLVGCGSDGTSLPPRTIGTSTADGAPVAPAPSEADAKILRIFHAGSLSLPLKRLARSFETRYPGVRVEREASGSRVAARKITELGRRADLFASADVSVIQNLMMPAHAQWFCAFARNEMVIAFTERSRFANEIDEKNWVEILLRPEVRFGHSDPDKDPCGYRTRMVWQLADLHYGKRPGGKSIHDALVAACPASNIRPGSVELLPLLESMSLDYAFEYRSVAEQHGLRHLRLPREINLSDPGLVELYARARVQVSGKTPDAPPVVQVGTPIVYGFTIPTNAPNPLAARRFADLLLGEEGRRIFREAHQEIIFGGRIGFLPNTIVSLKEDPPR